MDGLDRFLFILLPLSLVIELIAGFDRVPRRRLGRCELPWQPSRAACCCTVRVTWMVPPAILLSARFWIPLVLCAALLIAELEPTGAADAAFTRHFDTAGPVADVRGGGHGTDAFGLSHRRQSGPAVGCRVGGSGDLVWRGCVANCLARNDWHWGRLVIQHSDPGPILRRAFDRTGHSHLPGSAFVLGDRVADVSHIASPGLSLPYGWPWWQCRSPPFCSWRSGFRKELGDACGRRCGKL